MSKLARIIIGNNVKQIRKELALSLLNFSILCGLSKASIVNIEAGKNGYNLNLLDKITTFTGYSLKDLSDENFLPDSNLRDSLLLVYKNNHTIHTILTHQPNIVYAINHKILNSQFLDVPKEIREIKELLNEIVWDYNGVSISVALKRMPDLIKIEPHPSKKGTFIYSKR